MKKQSFLNWLRRVCSYLKKQSLQDYGTLLVGITAFVTIFFTNNMLDKILRIENLSKNTHEASVNIQKISEDVQQTLNFIKKAMTSEKAKTIVEKINEKKGDDMEIRKVIEEVPSFPNYKSDRPQFILSKKDKGQLLEAIAEKKFVGAEHLQEQLLRKLEVVIPSYVQGYRAVISDKRIIGFVILQVLIKLHFKSEQLWFKFFPSIISVNCR